VSHHRPTRPADRHGFDAIIDARSPAEFAEDHIPGAINCPVLDDAERATVGTLYAQQGAFEARRVGGAMVAANLARHLRQQFADKPQGWRPLIYCWRGGMRSGSMVQWLRLVGWDAQQLAGGYKAFRRHVIEQIAALVPRLDLRVLVGATGSAKTRVLQALASQGAQVLDLEHCARHKGSLLGAMPGVEQPSQKNFETQIATALEGFDLSRPVYVEGESARIGRLSLPVPLVQRLRAGACLEIQATARGAPGLPAARLRLPGRRPRGPGPAPGGADRAARQGGGSALADLGPRATTGAAVRRTDAAALRPALRPLAGAQLCAVAGPPRRGGN